MSLVAPKIQASWFKQVRKSHETENIEDYVELIADLLRISGEARVVDLTNRLGVSRATVSKLLSKLGEKGYIEYAPYKPIGLTSKGAKLAKKCNERHQIIVDFLVSIGVSRSTAELDAEGIEHHVSKETLAVFKKYKDS